jgi:hypothetical protein
MNIGFNKVKFGVFIEERMNIEDLQQLLKYKKTKILSLRGLKLDNLEFLLSLKELEDLRIYRCVIKDPSALYKLEKLTKLFINNVKKENDNFSFLNQLDNLEKLSIGYASQFTSFPDLANCKNLKRVNLFNCKRLEDISKIKNIKNLEAFSIVETQHKPQDLEFIMEMPKVKFMSGAFGGKKVDQEFHDFLNKHGLQYG